MKIFDGTSVRRIFSQSIRNHNREIIVEGKPESVKSPVMVFTQTQSVVDAVIVKLTERLDVCSIYDILQSIEHLQAAERTTVFVDRNDDPPKCTISNNRFLLAFTSNLVWLINAPASRK